VTHRVRRKPKVAVAVSGAATLTVAVGIVLASMSGDEPPTLQISVSDSPNGEFEAAPAEFNESASSLYEGQREYCRQPWSALLFEAGEPPSTSFSRSALRQVAAKLPHARRFTDELLVNIATDGCVTGFLALLKTNRSYALS
jgi:hypothetical protein